MLSFQVASANIKTPSMTIPFKYTAMPEQRERLRAQMTRLTLADLLERVKVEERVVAMARERKRAVIMRFQWLPADVHKSGLSGNQILSYFERKFVGKVLAPVIYAAMSDKKTVIEEGNEKATAANTGPATEGREDDDLMRDLDRCVGGEGHASSDEEDGADDADATEARKRARQTDGDREEGLSDEEEEILRDLSRRLANEEGEEESNESRRETLSSGAKTPEPHGDEGFDELPSIESDEDNEREEDLSASPSPTVAASMEEPAAAARRNAVLTMPLNKARNLISVSDYVYDVEEEKWCELTLAFPVSRRSLDVSNVLRKACEKAIVREVKGIRRAFLGKNEKGEHTLTTEGANIEAMFAYDSILNLNRLSCNNVHDVAKYYGVEAANRTIVREIVNVFSAYGIGVDKRHLTLIADYMTFDGQYKPFNRHGIANNPSPLQQMTFETAIGFLRSASLAAKTDTLDSPSSCIVVGKPCHGGTTSFGLVQDLRAGL